MDPHSTPTTGYETEVEAVRARGGVAATLNAVLVTGGLWALQIMSGSAPLSTWAEKNDADSGGWAATLLGDRLAYFGDGPLGDLFSGETVVHTAILSVTVFFVTWLLTWLATVGIRPRAFFPVLLGCWLGAIVAAATGQVTEVLYSYFSDGRSGSLLASLDDVLASGASYGVTYGWAIGLLVALIWLAVPGKSRSAASGDVGPRQEYTPMSTLLQGPGGAPGGHGQQMRSGGSVPATQPGIVPVSPSGRPAQPVQARTFTGPARSQAFGSGPAGDTAAWKNFVRDVRGQS